MNIKIVPLLAMVVIGTLSTGCSKHKCPQADDRALASSWMHNAVEYDYINEATYRSARPALIRALKDKSLTASIEQKAIGGWENLPPCIILDLDETVIDNGPFQGHIIKNGKNFNPQLWQEWSDLSAAKPLAGAVDFLKFARANGVTPIFISNRVIAEKENTIKNLLKIGIFTNEDEVLLKNERENWTSDKGSRREWVAGKYRILLLFGDDLNDFVSVKGKNTKERKLISQPYTGNFGDTWFILPNPAYGTWEPAIYGGNYPGNYEEEHAIRVKSLKDFKDPTKKLP
jgi:acid phosphatase